MPVNGLLSGDKVKPVLMNSKLPLDVLGKVRNYTVLYFLIYFLVTTEINICNVVYQGLGPQ